MLNGLTCHSLAAEFDSNVVDPVSGTSDAGPDVPDDDEGEEEVKERDVEEWCGREVSDDDDEDPNIR